MPLAEPEEPERPPLVCLCIRFSRSRAAVLAAGVVRIAPAHGRGVLARRPSLDTTLIA